MLNIIRLPGLIDIHVHFRDPGETEKEDFLSGTKSALHGGNVAVFDMPNNREPIFTYEKLIEKIGIAEKKAVCDWGLYFGSNGNNISEFEKVKNLVVGLKIFLNTTTGNFFIENNQKIQEIFESWPKEKAIVAHAENEKVDIVLKYCSRYKNKTHITHVATKVDLEKIITAKKSGLNITCDVTPHHLILNRDALDNLKGYGFVKPVLQKQEDINFLWNNLDRIDCIATDHAPHAKKEKESDNPPYGLPGVETRLSLLLDKVADKKLSIKDFVRLTNAGPRKIFNIKEDNDSYVLLDLGAEYTLKAESLHMKCDWTPYENYKVHGKLKDVYIRGKKVFEDGNILVKPGFGRNIAVL